MRDEVTIKARSKVSGDMTLDDLASRVLGPAIKRLKKSLKRTEKADA